MAAKKKPNTNRANTAKSKDARKKPLKDTLPADPITADIERAKALRLKVDGHTYREIAATLGVSVSTAHKYVHDGWDEIKADTDEDREKLRQVQEQRLDAGFKVVLPLLTTEGLIVVAEDHEGMEVREDAANLRLRAIDRLVKLVACGNLMRGLNAPTKIEDMGRSNLIPLEELARKVAENQAKKDK